MAGFKTSPNFDRYFVFRSYTGWAEKAGRQTHDHNSVKYYPI